MPPSRFLPWLVLLALARVSSAGDLSLADLVAQALRDNRELQALRAEVDAAQGRLLQAGLRPNPSLDLGVQQNVTGPDNNVSVSLSLPLDLHGRQAGRVGVAAQGVELKRAQVADRERRLRAEVQMQAGAVLAAQRHVRLTAELLQASRQTLALLQARVQQGAAPPLDAQVWRVELHRLEASAHLLESRVVVLTAQLHTLVGRDPMAPPLALSGELQPWPLRLDLEQGVAQALATRPDLRSAQIEVAGGTAMLRKEQAEGRWDASVNVGYMRQSFGYDLQGLTARGNTQPIHDVFHYVGAGFTLTLPVRHQNQGNVAAALAETRAAERRLEALTLQVRQEVSAAFTTYHASQRALAIYAQGVRDLARQNLDVVRQSYSLGRASLLDVIAEQRRYIESETGYTDALQQVYNARVELARALGEEGP